MIAESVLKIYVNDFKENCSQFKSVSFHKIEKISVCKINENLHVNNFHVPILITGGNPWQQIENIVIHM